MGVSLRPLAPVRSLNSALLSSSAALPREVKMLAIVTAALIVLATTAEAAISKYDYGGRERHKHYDDGSYEPKRYDHGSYKPSFESHYADQENSHGPSYYADRDYREPHHDSYDEDHYGGDAYLGEQ